MIAIRNIATDNALIPADEPMYAHRDCLPILQNQVPTQG